MNSSSQKTDVGDVYAGRSRDSRALVIYAIGQQTDYYFDATAIAQGKRRKISVSVLEVWSSLACSEHQMIRWWSLRL